MRDAFQKLRELWAHPKYKILLKFAMYGVFFILIFIIIAIGSGVTDNSERETRTSYNFMKLELTSNSLLTTYRISINHDDESTTEYYLEGTIINGVWSGTLGISNVERIIIDEDGARNKDDDAKVLSDINTDYLLPDKVMEMIKGVSSTQRQVEEKIIYTHIVGEVSYHVTVSEDKIIQIDVIDGATLYKMEYTLI